MVRHVILWKLKEMPDAEKAAVKAGIKWRYAELAEDGEWSIEIEGTILSE